MSTTTTVMRPAANQIGTLRQMLRAVDHQVQAPEYIRTHHPDELWEQSLRRALPHRTADSSREEAAR